jgi:hypothetical protein
MARNFTHALLYPEQLKKCLPGLTTNANEGLNAQFWRRSPKSSFVSLPSLKISLYDAILCRNEGYISRADLFKSLNFVPGRNYQQSLFELDRREKKREKVKQKGTNHAEDCSDNDYQAGAHT